MPRLKKRAMTRVRFHCGACGLPVTRPVRHLADRRRLSRADSTAAIPPGFWCGDGPPDAWVDGPSYLVHVRAATAGYSPRPGYGCCGYSADRNNPNRVCPGGHPVGWEYSDCWTGAAGVWLAADRVLISDGDRPPFPLAPVNLDWLEASGRAAYHLARGIDDRRAWDALPVLADALEEGGCDAPAVLGHLRAPGGHRGGCWVVDQLLGKA